MKTVAKITGCLCMLSFLVFAWMSHSGVLPGSDDARVLGGVGLFVLVIAGFVLLLATSKGSSHAIVNVFCFSYGVLLILNAIVFTFLRTANLIGPVYTSINGPQPAVLFGILYYILVIFGICLIRDSINDMVVSSEKDL